MSVYAGPEIATNGLVFAYDMGNTDKSLKGPPTVNYYSIPTPDVSGNVAFSLNGTGTFKRVTSGTYGGYDIKSSDVVYRMDFTTTNGCYYHGNDNITGFATGDVITFSFDYYISPGTTGYPSVNFLGNIEIYDTNPAGWIYIGGASATDPTPSTIGVWKTATMTATVGSYTSGLTVRPLLYPGACNPSRLADTGFILYRNPQLEKRSFKSPFIAGTRSNTQSIIDLTGTNTLTANALTFASDGTFSFNGTNNFMTISGSSTFQQLQVPQTITAIFKTSSTPSYNTIFGKYKSVSQSQLFSLLRIDSGTLVYYTSRNDASQIQGVSSDTTITPGNWYIVSIIIDGNTTTPYYQFVINGVAGTRTALSPLFPTPDSTVVPTIGASNPGGEFFAGTIANVTIHNRALTVEECKRFFVAHRGRFGL